MNRPHRSVMGNAEDRRRRRRFLIRKQIPHRDPRPMDLVSCYHCGKNMRAMKSTWDVDRYPVSGARGGTYRRNNIVAACRKCNRGRGG